MHHMHRLIAQLRDLDVIEPPPGWVERAIEHYERTKETNVTTTITITEHSYLLAASLLEVR